MEITKNVPVTIIVDDNNPALCSQLCDNFIDDKCRDVYYCRYYNCDLYTFNANNDIHRNSQCVTDFWG